MQETYFHNLIAYNDAQRHSVVVEDKVNCNVLKIEIKSCPKSSSNIRFFAFA